RAPRDGLPLPPAADHACACDRSGRDWFAALRVGVTHGYEKADTGGTPERQEGPVRSDEEAHDRPSSGEHPPRPPARGAQRPPPRPRSTFPRGPEPAAALRAREGEGHPRPLEDGQERAHRRPPQGPLTPPPPDTATQAVSGSCDV